MARRLDPPGLKALGLSPSDIGKWDAAASGGGGGGGSGDVTGPSSATDGNLAVFDGTDGKKIKDGGPVPGGSSNVSVIDLGMVSLSDAATYGRSRPLIPYADGRLIKSVRFAPGGTPTSFPNDNTVYFVTPNTSKNSGFANVGQGTDKNYDSFGVQYSGNATRLDLGESSRAQILDVGPLMVGVWNSPNSEYLPLGTWQPNTAYCSADVLLDSNGHIQYSGGDSNSGVSGGTEPIWDTSGGQVVDGTLLWTDFGELPSGEIRAVAEVIEGVSPMPPYPASIEWVAQPVDTIAGGVMPDFTVILKDQSGNPYTLCAQTIFLSFFGNGTWSSGGSEAFADTDTTTGIATFSGYAIQNPGTGYVVRARLIKSVVADPVDSDPFNVIEFPITAVNQGTKTFTVTGDASGINASFVVAGSTGNDGTYTLVSAIFAAGSTNIIVVEAIPDPTADGFVHD